MAHNVLYKNRLDVCLLTHGYVLITTLKAFRNWNAVMRSTL